MKKYLIRKIKNNKRAFTLVEMLVVLVIVALLMAIIIPNVAGQRDRIQEQAKTNIAEIIEMQMNTFELVEADSDVTLAKLSSGGYITVKQSNEAQNLLGLTESETLTLPLLIEP
ncbi:competence type IV pilus major pilin ComGC [Fundicoccus culcitae]|uniref:Competence type IV pilus major pilin ComGC n=1 Tax=Fundicoccus culcitae TaxID=2969821 RepID=A0ABY5P783_9LACT|nr:competence type IV pilus major pilin ComGC [Fundicoccus culcitae]UUX34230.1 competence type IV pilus major pilin ComGC [Fundicoccus culcitae]